MKLNEESHPVTIKKLKKREHGVGNGVSSNTYEKLWVGSWGEKEGEYTCNAQAEGCIEQAVEVLVKINTNISR